MAGIGLAEECVNLFMHMKQRSAVGGGADQGAGLGSGDGAGSLDMFWSWRGNRSCFGVQLAWARQKGRRPRPRRWGRPAAAPGAGVRWQARRELRRRGALVGAQPDSLRPRAAAGLGCRSPQLIQLPPWRTPSLSCMLFLAQALIPRPHPRTLTHARPTQFKWMTFKVDDSGKTVSRFQGQGRGRRGRRQLRGAGAVPGGVVQLGPSAAVDRRRSRLSDRQSAAQLLGRNGLPFPGDS
jgi:hypothetical protein